MALEKGTGIQPHSHQSPFGKYTIIAIHTRTTSGTVIPQTATTKELYQTLCKSIYYLEFINNNECISFKIILKK